jgi:hypothetical protein
MATATKSKTKGIKKRDRVVATIDLPGVPEGTAGKVKLVNGLGPWIRCWVKFDNGVWMGSVSSAHLVAADDWEDYKVRRAEEAEAAKHRAAAAATAPAEAPAAADAGAAAPSAAASKVPAHLLERAKAARERKAAAAAAGE